MTLSYKLNKKDYNDFFFQFIIGKHGIVVLLLVLIITIVWIVYTTPSLLTFSISLWPSIFLVLMILLPTFFFILRAIKQSEENGPLYQLQSTHLSDERIVINDSDGFHFFTWDKVQNVQTSKRNYFLQIAPKRAIIIPKRALFSIDEQREFEGLLSRNVNSYPTFSYG